MRAMLASGMQDRVRRMQEAVQTSDVEIRLFVVETTGAAKAEMLARPVEILLADAELSDGSGLELCNWAQERFPGVQCLLFAESCGFELAGAAIESGLCAVLPTDAEAETVIRTLGTAIRRLKSQREDGSRAAGIAAVAFSEKLKEGRKLERFLASGSNLQEILMDGILPEQEPLYLVRIGLQEANKEAYPDLMRHFLTDSLAHQAFDADWQLSPVVMVNEETFGFLLWERDPEFLGNIQSDAEKLHALVRRKTGCLVSLRKDGPMDIRSVPEKWHQMIMQETVLPNGDGMPKGMPLPPEVQLWADMLASKNPQDMVKHIHKYVAERWQGMPPSRNELMQMHAQFLQAVAVATDRKEFWGGILMDREKYALYNRANRSLEGLFAFVQMTVSEFARMNDSGEVSLGERVRLYLEANMEETVYCSDVAAQFKMCADSLNRQFKKETGETLKAYIVAYKMRTARQLLRMTLLPVSTVGDRVGYPNFSHFSTVYKKTFGETPMETRQSARSENEG